MPLEDAEALYRAQLVLLGVLVFVLAAVHGLHTF